MTKAEVNERIARGEMHVTPRVRDAGAGGRRSARARFAEVNLGYTDEEAQAEAARCLACGVCSECLSCWYKCGVGAIDHDMVERWSEVQVGAVILAPGYEVYNAKLSQEYGLGRYPNVVTALQFERLLSASGPTLRPRQAPVGQANAQKDRLPAVRRHPRPEPRLLLVGVLHVRHQRSHHGHRARPRRGRRLTWNVTSSSWTCAPSARATRNTTAAPRKKYGIQYHRTRISALKENPANGNLILHYVAMTLSDPGTRR